MVRWITFLETTQELQVTWWDMEATIPSRFITEVPQLCRSRLTRHLSLAGEAMPPGLAGSQATPMSLAAPLLADLMLTTTLLIKETTTSKQSRLHTTMPLFLAYWHDCMPVLVAITSSFPVCVFPFRELWVDFCFQLFIFLDSFFCYS